MTTPLLQVRGMQHRGWDVPPIVVLPGEAVALVGQPGTGKSVVLRTAAGLREAGVATVERPVACGYVFAEGGLVATLSVRDNLRLPLSYAGAPDAEARVDAAVAAWRLERACDELPLALTASAQRLVQFARVECLGAPLAVIEESPLGTENSERVRGWWRRHLGGGGGILVAVSAMASAERLGARPVLLDPTLTRAAVLPGARTEIFS